MKRAQSGFTLMEALMAATLAALVFGAVLQVSVQMTGEVGVAVAETDITKTLRKVSDRLTNDIASSGVDSEGTDYMTSHPSGVATESDSITFQQRIALDGLASDWGDPITYQLQPSGSEVPGNDIDDDGDFVVDEQRLVRVQNGTVEIIADSVTSLNILREDDSNEIVLTVGLSRGLGHKHDPLAREIEIQVSLRNQ